ncbi:hypothetical protein ACW2Q0_29100 [Nocardia sp. R16R-3T]
MDTQLKALLRQRHWQTLSTFRREYDKVAATVDPAMVGQAPQKAQFYRWLSGDVKSLPYPDQCRILEAMLPGYSVEQLFSPPQPVRPEPDRSQSSNVRQLPVREVPRPGSAAVPANASVARDLGTDSNESHVTWDPEHGEVLGGRSDWMKHRNDLSKSSAQPAIDAARAAWFADHPEREERAQARRDADAVHLAASQDLDAIQNARMRELMSWVPTPERRSPLADYQPGSALANALDRSTEREGMER